MFSKSKLIVVVLLFFTLNFNTYVSAGELIKFKDIGNHWAKSQIEKWMEQGKVSGYDDGTFRPDKAISRAEIVTILNNFLEIKNTTNKKSSFVDVQLSDWYYENIALAEGLGYISGYSGNIFKPNNIITRAEVASILDKLLKLGKITSSKPSQSNHVDVKNFGDIDQIPLWAFSSVDNVIKNGLMQGYPDNTFGAERPITRAEAITVFDNIFSQKNNDIPTPTSPSPTTPTSSDSSNGGEGDTTPPIVQITSPTVTGTTYTVSTPTITVSGTAWDNISVDGVAYSLTVSGVTYKQGTAIGTTNWSVPDLQLQQGNNVVTITAKDLSGNTTSKSISIIYTPTSIIIDTLAPIVQITSPTVTGTTYTVSTPTITVSGTAWDNVTVDSVAYSLTVSGVTYKQGTAFGTTNWSVPDLQLQPNLNILNISAKDPSGNSTNKSITIYYVQDGDSPFIQIFDQAKVVTKSNLTVTGMVYDTLPITKVSYELQVTGLNNATYRGIAEGTNKWSIPNLELQPGNNLIGVTAVDSIGDTFTDSITITYDDGIKRPQVINNPSLNFSVSFSATGVASDTTAVVPADITQYLGGSQGVFGQIEFNTRSQFDTATLVFNYDPSLLQNTNPKDLRIFFYNTKTGKPELLNNETVDPINHTVSATTTHNSIYILGDINTWANNWLKNTYRSTKLDLVFVIDSTGSMQWNDPNRYRVSGTKDVIDKLGSEDRAAIFKFTQYATLLKEFTNDKDSLKNATDQIDANGGTNINAGVRAGLELIKKDGRIDATKYIILLTDGSNDPPAPFDSTLLDLAKSLGVKIHSIGLGNSVDTTFLKNISDTTGGDFYLSKDAQQLSDIFKKTGGKINVDPHPVQYKPAIVLIHGINSDSNAWGAKTWVNNSNNAAQGYSMLQPIHDKGDTGTFIQDTSNSFTRKTYQKGTTISLEQPDAHFIDETKIDPNRLVNYLFKQGYKPNNNLFVFDWEANDHIYDAAKKLDAFLQNISKFLNEKSEVNIWKDGRPQFILVGHSAGGLVSRMYTENFMETDPNKAHIEKLITLDTPHWGSQLANNPGPCQSVLGDLNRNQSYLYYNDKDPSTGHVGCRPWATLGDQVHDELDKFHNSKSYQLIMKIKPEYKKIEEEYLGIVPPRVKDMNTEQLKDLNWSEEEYYRGVSLNPKYHQTTKYYAVGAFTYDYTEFGWNWTTRKFVNYQPVVIPVDPKIKTDGQIKDFVKESIKNNVDKRYHLFVDDPTSELFFGDNIVTIGSQFGIPSDAQRNKEKTVDSIKFNDRALIIGRNKEVWHSKIEYVRQVFDKILSWINQ
ncbi:S-layer homology domain-containing protein [Paenibacillus sp. GP183]|uniref:S-layer homology domain-containing protein n=1 Tax=Paenibacillus sp. GP183 TaxID=1882751 RepID=UPI00089C4E53|nr:S-layer homology domain-containing protein [Paenibacillus sp. GP183]SEC18389.1 PGAP1-like protein [Paenibacillus sp. GP183]